MSASLRLCTWHLSRRRAYRRRARKPLGLSPNHYPHLCSSPDGKPVKARKTQLDRPWNLCGPRGVQARIDRDVGKSQGLSQGMNGPHGLPVSRPGATRGTGTAAQRSLFARSTVRSGRAGPSGANVAGCRSLRISWIHLGERQRLSPSHTGVTDCTTPRAPSR